MAERIRAGGDDTAQYVDVSFKVPERKYSAWPDGIRASFEPERTIRAGTLKVMLKAQGDADSVNRGRSCRRRGRVSNKGSTE